MTQEEKNNFLLQKDEINRQCCEVIYRNVTFLRDNWVKEMEACNWGAKLNEIDAEEEAMMREVCDFVIYAHLVLIDMLIESNVDFTTGYESIIDAIADVRHPESISFRMMEREHKKYLSGFFYSEFIERINKSEYKRNLRKIRELPVIFYEKKGSELFNHSLFRMYKNKLGLQNLELKIAIGLEELLGGKCVLINCEEALFGEYPVTISIKESIGYDFKTQQFFIKPQSKIKDYIGCLHIKEIPTMSTDNKLWLKYFRETNTGGGTS